MSAGRIELPLARGVRPRQFDISEEMEKLKERGVGGRELQLVVGAMNSHNKAHQALSMTTNLGKLLEKQGDPPGMHVELIERAEAVVDRTGQAAHLPEDLRHSH